MDDTTRATINAFLAHYETLVIATEHEGQPFVTLDTTHAGKEQRV